MNALITSLAMVIGATAHAEVVKEYYWTYEAKNAECFETKDEYFDYKIRLYRSLAPYFPNGIECDHDFITWLYFEGKARGLEEGRSF